MEQTFSASVWREEGLYVAQCLEVDVGARVLQRRKPWRTYAKRWSCTSSLPTQLRHRW